MRKAMLFAGLVVALVALAVVVPGSARSAAHGTSLPFNGPAAGHMTLNLMTGDLHMTWDALPLTHLGLRTGECFGWSNPDGSQFSAEGTTTAANGDQLIWTSTEAGTVYTGGTGRFEGATGHSIAGWTEYTNITISPDLILDADFHGYGTGVLNLNRP